MVQMEIVRDFSDEAKNSLLNAIEAAEQRKHGLLFLSEFWDFISDWAIPGKMSDYQMIEEYYKNIANKHDITKEQLNTIFTNAYAAEARFIARMKPIRAEMDALNTSLLDLVNLVDISPLERGETVLLALPVDEFGQKLSNITAPYQQAVYDRVCSYDEAGNIVYNWDAIDDILNKAPGDITELEYCILAELYSAMGTEDTTKFLQALADKTADVESSSGSPYSYTEWAYDP
jgi:predicted DNA-binding ArsR family transcriptional regulator